MNRYRPLITIAALLLCLTSAVQGANLLDRYDVVWDSPSEDSRGSMPLGNGDIGLNVWVEKGGDLLFYLSKTDAWSDNVYETKGLLKLGRIRVKFSLNPFAEGNAFRQVLRPSGGCRGCRTGQARAGAGAGSDGAPGEDRLGRSSAATGWFPEAAPSLVRSGRPSGIACESTPTRRRPQRRRSGSRGSNSGWPRPTPSPSKRPTNCMAGGGTRSGSGAGSRPWYGGSPPSNARLRAPALRHACAGRGAYPIKFNGSIFTMDWHKSRGPRRGERDHAGADQRDWGGQYWFQNTRPIYWPLLPSGDFEMMRPLFRMYQGQLPDNAKDVREFYGHDGAHLPRPLLLGRANAQCPVRRHRLLHDTLLHANPRTQRDDARLLRLHRRPRVRPPHAAAGRRCRGDVLRPAFQARERQARARARQRHRDLLESREIPAPDIAGLRWVLAGSGAAAGLDERAATRPLAEAAGGNSRTARPAKLAASGCCCRPRYSTRAATPRTPSCTPSVPFRLFGLGKPGLKLARATFAARRFK